MADKQKIIEKISHTNTHTSHVVDNSTLIGRLIYNVGMILLVLIGILLYFMWIYKWYIIGVGSVVLAVIMFIKYKKGGSINPFKRSIEQDKKIEIEDNPADRKMSEEYGSASWRPQYESSY